MGGTADGFVGINDENSSTLKAGPLFDLFAGRQSLDGGHGLSDFLDYLLNISGMAENALQALPPVGVVANIALHDIDGVVEDFIDRQRYGPVNGLHAFLGSIYLLHCEEFQGI